jgi:hypothetical protein
MAEWQDEGGMRVGAEERRSPRRIEAIACRKTHEMGGRS